MKQTPRRQTVHTQVFECKNNTAPAQLRFPFEVIDPEELLHLGLFLKQAIAPDVTGRQTYNPRVYSPEQRELPKRKLSTPRR